MFTAVHRASIRNISAVALVAVILAAPVQAVGQQSKGGLNLGAGVSLGGVKAGLGASVGGSKGLAGASVGASVGGSGGVNAGARANLGGSGGLVDSGVTASIGGGSGLNARVGGGSLLDANIGIGAGMGNSGTGGNVDGMTGRDRDILRNFSQLSRSERLQLIKRCRGVNSGGYDAALVKLCRLLETASR